MATIESLDIQIKADANNAEKGIDSLVKKLDLLSAKLRGTNLASRNAFGNIGGSSDKIGKAFDKLQKNFNNFSNSTNSSRKSVNNFTLSFVSLYAKVRLLTGALKTLGKSVQNTADYGEAFNYYTVAFGKIASRWDENWESYADDNARNYANKFVSTLNDTLYKLSGIAYNPETGLISETGIKNLGLNLKEATQYAAQLASMMDAVGQSGETTLATTNAFVKLAADMSSLVNVDYAEAASKIRSVLQGQSRAGYSFGWDTTIAALQTTADRLDLSKPVIAMSQMEKQQLRILTVLEQSRVAWGDQSNTINSMANQMRIFKNNLQEVSMTLGQLFIPALSEIMPIANGALIAIKRLLGGLASLLGIEIKDIGQGFIGAEEDIEGMTEGLDDATSSAKKLSKQLGKFDELNILGTASNVGTFSNLGEQIDLTKEIIEATEEYEKAWAEAYEKMENKALLFADKLESKFSKVKNAIEPIFAPFFELDWETITQNIKDFGKALEPYAEEFGEGFIKFFSELSGISAETIENIFGNNGIITDFTDWLNNNDPKKAEKWGYSLGVLVTALASFKTLSFLGGMFGGSGGKSKNIIGLENLSKALALFIPIETYFSTKTESGAAKYLESLSKITRLDFSNMKLPDWLNALKEFAMSTIGLSGSKFAMDTLISDLLSDMPRKEDFATLEEYNKALKEYEEQARRILEMPGVEYTDSGWNKFFIDFVENVSISLKGVGDSIAEWWSDVFFEMEIDLLQMKNAIKETFSFFTNPKGGFALGGKNAIISPHRFANGGFPEDGLFFANHNELVGGFSNGKTAVANNEQITDGIANAVYPAVYNAVMAAMSNGKNGSSPITIEIGGREVFKAVQDEANNYSKRTGRPAFS